MAGETIYQLDGVTFDYPGGQPALRDVNLEIGEGESLVVLGANASGKSTLLQLLDGLYFPAAGTLKAFDRQLSEATLQDPDFNRFFRRRVGLMFQSSDVQLFCATVEEELAFAPLQLHLSYEEVERRVADVLALLEMEQLRDRSPQSLSGGEKKRVALGGLLTASPQVLLLDEPTAGLDPRSQQWLLELVAQLRAGGMTLIIASHDLELAPEIANRAVVISEQHRIAADGTVAEILEDLDLLLEANLIHAHAHAHGSYRHVHPHLHGQWHDHQHRGEDK